MDMEVKWKYYNHMIVPDCEPKANIMLNKADKKALFARFNKAYLIRYTSNLDQFHGDWYYCVKDSRFDFEGLKSKRKNVLRKAQKNFTVKEIDPIAHIAEFYEIINDANQGYSYAIAMQDMETITQRCQALHAFPNSFFLGAFSSECNQLVGYLWVMKNGKCLNLVEQHCIRAYEKQECNAALVMKLCEIYNDLYFSDGYYLCDGERTISHETKFQDYLEKYFGFRKAFCRLHVHYRFPFSLLVKFAYPLFACFQSLFKTPRLSAIKAVMTIEQIRRKQNNDRLGANNEKI